MFSSLLIALAVVSVVQVKNAEATVLVNKVSLQPMRTSKSPSANRQPKKVLPVISNISKQPTLSHRVKKSNNNHAAETVKVLPVKTIEKHHNQIVNFPRLSTYPQMGDAADLKLSRMSKEQNQAEYPSELLDDKDFNVRMQGFKDILSDVTLVLRRYRFHMNQVLAYLSFHEISEQEFRKNFYVPLEGITEINRMNLVKDGSLKEAVAYVDQLIQEEFESKADIFKGTFVYAQGSVPSLEDLYLNSIYLLRRLQKSYVTFMHSDQADRDAFAKKCKNKSASVECQRLYMMKLITGMLADKNGFIFWLPEDVTTFEDMIQELEITVKEFKSIDYKMFSNWT